MELDNKKRFNVIVLCFPATGHLNPLLSFVHELAKNKNLRIIFYGIAEHKSMIEETGAEFRHYEVPNLLTSIDDLQSKSDFKISKIFKYFMNITDQMMPELIQVVQEEQIDLVVYDFMTLYAKWTMKKLKIMHKNGKLKRPPPRGIMFNPSFVMHDGVFPNSFEAQFMDKPKLSLKVLTQMAIFAFKYTLFCFKYGFQLQNPISFWHKELDQLNICCIMPELQPRCHLLPKSIKFVGSCANEDIRLQKELEEPLKSFLEPFKCQNPLPISDNLKLSKDYQSNAEKLIYVSFGTIFNEQLDAYKKIINAFNTLDKEKKSIDQSKLRLLISTGYKIYDTFQELINKKEFILPTNVLLMRRVPQLDVLKRASLFISHCGQNSTSESLHYGVPMICLPVKADQPAVAYRVCDELGLGLRLSLEDEQLENKIRKAICELLTDQTYLERVLLFAKISQKYHGSIEASKIVIEYLQNQNIKN